LEVVGSERCDEVPPLWFHTAVRCLRCCGKYPVREMGFVMIQEAVRSSLRHHQQHYRQKSLATQLNTLISEKEGVVAVLDSIFTEEFAHHAVIRLVSTWLIDVFYREYCYEDDNVDLMQYLVDAAVHDWDAVEAVTDLLVRLTVTNISIKSLNSLCNLFKAAVENKATAAAGNKLILHWIDKTRQKKWVIAVQERVLNLLWTMLITKSSESEDDTAKVLDYFKNQFSNMKGHLTDWDKSLSEKETTARNCMLRCARESLAEIKQSGIAMASADRSHTMEELEELRSRATQSASLLIIVLDLVENLRPDVLRALHQNKQKQMLVDLFDELDLAAGCEDIDGNAVNVRLQLLAALSGYLVRHAPLTSARIEQLWHGLSGEYITVLLRWFTEVLRPRVTSTYHHSYEQLFFQQPEDVNARRFVLDQLSDKLQASPADMEALGEDAMTCFLSLFVWVNKDTSAFALSSIHPSSRSLDSEDETIEVTGLELVAYDALAVAALDLAPGNCSQAVRTLLTLSDAVFQSRVHSAQTLSHYDLTETVFRRLKAAWDGVDTLSKESATQAHHWLEVLSSHLSRLSANNSTRSHGSAARGTAIKVTLRMANRLHGVECDTNMSFRRFRELAAQAVGLDEPDPSKLEHVVFRTFEQGHSSHQSYSSAAMAGAELSLEQLQVCDGSNIMMSDLRLNPLDRPRPLKTSPSDELAGRTDVIDMLFSLLHVPECQEVAWGILQTIPTCPSVLESLDVTDGVVWKELLSPDTAFWRKIYICQIIEARLMPSEEQNWEALTAWRREFVERDGVSAVLSILESAGRNSIPPIPEMDSFTRSASLAPVIRVLYYCISNALTSTKAIHEAEADEAEPSLPSEPVLKRHFSITSADLVMQTVDLTKVIESLFSVIRIGANPQLSSGEIVAVSDSIATITAIVQQSSAEKWAAMSRAFPLDVLVHLLLESSVKQLRREVASTFHELITGGDYSLPSAADPSVDSPAPEVLGALFGSRLEGLPLHSDSAAEYFEITQELIMRGGTWFRPTELAAVLEKKIQEFDKPVVSSKNDSVLVGLLQTAATLVGVSPSLADRPEAEAITCFVFDTLLMRLPWAASPACLDHKSEPTSSAESGPICSTPASRLAACDLVISYGVVESPGGSALAKLICKRLHVFANHTAPPPPEQLVCRASEEIKTLARPGLHNSGNRCYMNSLTQQFASLPLFRDGILSTLVPPTVLEADAVEREREAKEAEEEEPTSGTWDCPVCTLQNDVAEAECIACGTPKPENAKITAAGVDPEEARKEREARVKAQKAVLREFQRTLRFITHGEMQYYDAEPLLKTVGKHLSLMYPAEQQNDTKEFMDKLLEALELELGDTSHANLIKRVFGATTAESKVRERDGKLVQRKKETTSTYFLNLQVEGMNSLEEALDSCFETSVREVDDEDDLDDAGKPKKAKFAYSTKVVEPPPVFCFQLSRFSFDYSRGVATKHNHRVEFPEELDVSKYTENPEGDGSLPPEECTYRLRGILVHLGPSANQGHYYSIIKEGDLSDPETPFLKFNDNHVSVADSIEDECFGGEQTYQRKDYYGQVMKGEKNWNAYLLFYERVASATKEEREKDVELAAQLEKLELDETATKLRSMQEVEVQTENEKLWRRNLLYQDAMLQNFREMIDRRLERTTGDDDLTVSLYEAAFSLYDHAALHCDELVASTTELDNWKVTLLSLIRANKANANSFFASIADSETTSVPTTAAVETPLEAPSDLKPNGSFLSRVILQVGSRYPVAAIRESGAQLIASAAARLAEDGDLPEPPLPSVWSDVVLQLLSMTKKVHENPELTEGFVAFVVAMAEHPVLCPMLLLLDLPAYICHLYLGPASPANDWEDDPLAVSAVTGKSLPKLEAARRTVTGYSQTTYVDPKLVLRALGLMLNPGSVDTAQLWSKLPYLSDKMLQEESFLQRVVDLHPIAGIKPYEWNPTPEEEAAALKQQGWTHIQRDGRSYWSKTGYQTSYEKPKPRKPSAVELDRKAMEAAVPEDLLVISLAMLNPTVSDAVVDYITLGIARSYPTNHLFEQRVEVLRMLLSVDSDGLQTTRMQAVVRWLDGAIVDLREEQTEEVRVLKPHAKCSRMEVLCTTYRKLAEHFPDAFPDELDWLKTWLERNRPPMKVTLEHLQGFWVNSQRQEVVIEGDQCSFAGGNPCSIALTDTGTYSVPGWHLSQEQSSGAVVVWFNTQNREVTRWMRPSTSMYTEDYRDNTYGPHQRPRGYHHQQGL